MEAEPSMRGPGMPKALPRGAPVEWAKQGPAAPAERSAESAKSGLVTGANQHARRPSKRRAGEGGHAAQRAPITMRSGAAAHNGRARTRHDVSGEEGCDEMSRPVPTSVHAVYRGWTSGRLRESVFGKGSGPGLESPELAARIRLAVSHRSEQPVAKRSFSGIDCKATAEEKS